MRDIDAVLPMEVQEQRVSGLLQSLLVAVCLRKLVLAMQQMPPPLFPPLTPHEWLNAYTLNDSLPL